MGRREENKARTRAALEGSALRLFLDQGYHRASIQQIVERARVARGTYYLYFRDKASVFKHLVNRVLDPMLEELARAREALADAATIEETQPAYLALSASLATIMVSCKDELHLYYREQRDPGAIGDWLRERTRLIDEMATGTIESLMARGLLRAADPVVIAQAMLGAVDRLVFAFLSGQEMGDPVEAGMEVVRLFGEGLLMGETY